MKQISYVLLSMADRWSLITNHGLVLLAVARSPELRLRDLAAAVGITERAVQGIVNDLVSDGYVERARQGRRNRYVVRGDRPLPGSPGEHEVSDLLHALVSARSTGPHRNPCEAVVLACSDHRYQEPLRTLLAAEGLLERAEVILWPGGASALAGPDARRLLATVEMVSAERGPERLLLVAHQGCRVPGAFVRRRRDPFTTRRAVTTRRHRAVDRVRRRLRIEPELWFLSERGARRVRAGGAIEPRIPRTSRPRAGRAGAA